MTYAAFPCSLARHVRLPWHVRLVDRLLGRVRPDYRCERCKNCRYAERLEELMAEFDRRHT